MKSFFTSLFLLFSTLVGAADYYHFEIRSTDDIDFLTAQGIDITSRMGNKVSCLIESEQLPIILSFNPTLEPKIRALSDYRSYAELTSELQGLASNDESCSLKSIGTSVQGRDIWEVKLTTVPLNEQNNVPKIAILATIHGDEPIAMNMAMRLVNFLLDTPQDDILAKSIIYLLPLQNPDGLALGRRRNANNVDLNRNFPDGANSDFGNLFDGPTINPAGCQKETLITMDWCVEHRFALALHLHGGAEVVVYPYGNNAQSSSVYTACPDDALFIELAKTYTIKNDRMWESTTYTNGIINGADWYAVDGELPDWQYRYTGTPALTVELFYSPSLGSQGSKYPATIYQSAIWNDNRDALIASINRACKPAVKGKVVDAATGEGISAKFDFTSGSGYKFFTETNGSYHRTMKSGTYQFSVISPGFKGKTVSVAPISTALEQRIFLEPSLEKIVLEPGWNLLSLSCEITAANYEQLINDQTLWVWNTVKYGKASSVVPGQGFWLFSDGHREVSLTPSPTTRLNAPLNGGWNLLGTGYAQTLPSVTPAMDNVWEWTLDEYVETNILKRWKGYWVFGLGNSQLEWDY